MCNVISGMPLPLIPHTSSTINIRLSKLFRLPMNKRQTISSRCCKLLQIENGPSSIHLFYSSLRGGDDRAHHIIRMSFQPPFGAKLFSSTTVCDMRVCACIVCFASLTVAVLGHKTHACVAACVERYVSLSVLRRAFFRHPMTCLKKIKIHTFYGVRLWCSNCSRVVQTMPLAVYRDIVCWCLTERFECLSSPFMCTVSGLRARWMYTATSAELKYSCIN